MGADDAGEKPFWRQKAMEDMTPEEWESLCDGCARCCLVKLEDEDTGEIHFTDIGCRLLDAKTCRCLDYKRRSRRVPDCVRLNPAVVRTLTWLPTTCAYKLVAEGKDLPTWHPLISGSSDSVHEAGISVRTLVAANEDDVPEEKWPERIIKLKFQRNVRAKTDSRGGS